MLTFPPSIPLGSAEAPTFARSLVAPIQQASYLDINAPGRSTATFLARTRFSEPNSPFSADIRWKSERHDIRGKAVWVCRPDGILSGDFDSSARPIHPATDWVSVANLALWRSPRGIDYHFGSHSISIWPEDRSGRAEISLQSGRCTHASGTLASLQCFTAKWERVQKSSSCPFLTTNRQDLLLPIRLLKGLWGTWANPESGDFMYAPTSTVSLREDAWYMKPLVEDDPRYAMHEYAATVMLKPGLRCSIILDRQLIDTATNTIRDEVHLECLNFSRHSQLLQVQRIAPVYCRSHPCWFDRFIPSRGHFDTVGIPQLGAGGSDDRDIPSTTLLRPNGHIFIDYFTTPGRANVTAKTIPFRYGDGYSDTTFNLLPHKSDGVVH